MANKFQMKRSAVASKVPLTTDVDLGEFAVNTNDGKVYIKRDNGTPSIILVGGAISQTDRILGRQSAGGGSAEEITCTAAGRALIDDADASAQRTTLGLGTLATQSGTFSSVVPYTGANQTVNLNTQTFINGQNQTFNLELNLDDLLGTRDLDPAGAFNGDGNYTSVFLYGYKDVAGTRIYTYQNYIEIYNETDAEDFNILWSWTPNALCDGYIFVDANTENFAVDVGNVSSWLQDFSDWSTKTAFNIQNTYLNVKTTSLNTLNLNGLTINNQNYVSSLGLLLPTADDNTIPYVSYLTKHLTTDPNFRFDGSALHLISSILFNTSNQTIGGNYLSSGGQFNLVGTYPNGENGIGSNIAITGTNASNRTATVGTASRGGNIAITSGNGAPSNATGGGVNIGGAGGTYVFTGGVGGNSSNATTNTGGAGASCTFNLGAGGNSIGNAGNGGIGGGFIVNGATGGTKTNNFGTAGDGSEIIINGGFGGASNFTGSGSNFGGAGGQISLIAGTGGASQNSTLGVGGAGGQFYAQGGVGGSGPNGNSGGRCYMAAGPGGNASATNGNGGAAGSFTFVGANGGTGRNGGNGSAYSLTAGNGGASTSSGAVANVAGNGGGLTVTAGRGGAAINSSISNIGGQGGNCSFNGGEGGSSTFTTGTVSGGPGGSFFLTGGLGGLATGSSGTNTGGSGGAIFQTGGSGANSTTAGNGTNQGGAGGGLVYAGGTGGNATNGTNFNIAGAGGELTISGGNAGTVTGTGTTGASGGNAGIFGGNSSGSVNGASVFICGGASVSGTSGNVFLASTSATSRGNVTIGALFNAAKLHVIGATEQLRIGVDQTNYYSTTVTSTGQVSFNAVGSSASFTFEDTLILTAQYFNWSSTTGASGYGLRNNAGVIESKNSGGAWTPINSLTDGDKGDISVSASGATWTIDNTAVSYAKIQNISATDRLLGRSTAGAGIIEEITCTAAGRALIDDADASAQRTTLGLGTLATQSGTFSGSSSGTNTGDQTITLTSDVTGSGNGSFAATIANDAVTYAKMQNVSATDRILGRQSSGAGDVEEITCTAAGRALIDDADASAQRTTLGLGTLATQSGTFSGTSSGTNTGDQSIFSTIAVAGQSNVVADSTTDTLTLVAGTNVSLTTDATTDTITINAVSNISDSALSTSWDGSTTTAPSQNAIFDVMPRYVNATDSTISATTLTNIPGLSIPLVAGTWLFEAQVYGQSSSTAGIRFGVNYSGTTTSIEANFFGQLATTTLGATARITAVNTASTTVGTTASAELKNTITGVIVVSNSGNLTISGLKVTSGTLTHRSSSWLKVVRIS